VHLHHLPSLHACLDRFVVIMNVCMHTGGDRPNKFPEGRTDVRLLQYGWRGTAQRHWLCRQTGAKAGALGEKTGAQAERLLSAEFWQRPTGTDGRRKNYFRINGPVWWFGRDQIVEWNRWFNFRINIG